MVPRLLLVHSFLQSQAGLLRKNIHDQWNNIKALCVVIGRKNAGANRITASTLDFCLLNYWGSKECGFPNLILKSSLLEFLVDWKSHPSKRTLSMTMTDQLAKLTEYRRYWSAQALAERSLYYDQTSPVQSRADRVFFILKFLLGLELPNFKLKLLYPNQI